MNIFNGIILSHFTMEIQPSLGKKRLVVFVFRWGESFCFSTIHRGWVARELEVESSVWEDCRDRFFPVSFTA